MDSLETRRLLAFVASGASTINGKDYQSIDHTIAVPGGYVSAGIYAKDTNFGVAGVPQPRGESDVFLALVKNGKANILSIGGASSQDLDTDDDRADFDGEPRRLGDDFVFGVDSRIRGADEYVSDVEIGPDGKLYVALLFRRTISLNTNNPKAPTLVATDEFAGNYTDSAILRFDVSGRKFVYEDSMQIGGPFNDFIYDIDFDATGHLIVGGAYQRRTDFDPSEGTFFREPDGRGDGFVAKYSLDFKLQWVSTFGGDSGDESRPDAVYSVAPDADGNIYAGGSFSRTADFDPRTGRSQRDLIKSQGSTDAFTIKLKSNGTRAWVRTQGGDRADAIKRVTLAPDGGVYNVGYFEEEADLHGDRNVEQIFEIARRSDGETDLFFTRFDADGNQLWVKPLSGTGLELIADASTAANGDLVLAGTFFGSADFDPSKRQLIRTSPATRKIDDDNVGERDRNYSGFIAVYTPDGKHRRSTQLDGSADQDVFITGATLAANGQISVAGRYRGGFSVNGEGIVGTRRDIRREREDGYTLVFNGNLTPIV